MADNVRLSSAADTAGAVIATDDDGTAQHQYVKLEFGGDGTFTKVTTAAPLPVQVYGAVSTDTNGLGKIEDAAHASGDVGVMMLGVRQDTLATFADASGDYTPFQIDGSGRLYTAGDTSKTYPVSGDTTKTYTVDGDTAATYTVAGTATVTNAGVFAVQVDAALPAGTNAIGKLAANSGVDIGDVDILSVTPGTAASNLGKAEDAAHTSGDVGVMALGVRSDTVGALAGTSGDYAPIQVNPLGAAYVQDVPSYQGGLKGFLDIDGDSAATQVTDTPGQLYWAHVMNMSSEQLYLKLFNASDTAVTVGTTSAKMVFPIAAPSDTSGAGFTFNIDKGMAFSTGISSAVVTGPTDTAAIGPTATNAVIINLGYMDTQ